MTIGTTINGYNYGDYTAAPGSLTSGINGIGSASSNNLFLYDPAAYYQPFTQNGETIYLPKDSSTNPIQVSGPGGVGNYQINTTTPLSSFSDLLNAGYKLSDIKVNPIPNLTTMVDPQTVPKLPVYQGLGNNPTNMAFQQFQSNLTASPLVQATPTEIK